MERHSKDDIAEHLYGPGRKYAHLSAWGQNKVDHLHATMYPDPSTSRLQSESALRQETLRLASQLEQSRLENTELWDENTQLKEELAELQASFNPPSS